MDIRVKAVESTDELRMAHDVMAQVHGGKHCESVLHRLERYASAYPGFKQEHVRFAYLDREVVGALRLTTDTIRIGEARLKMGGVGWVSTSERHRGKGVCRLLAEDALRYMREHRYQVSMLFGIPDLYHRFGYVTTLADYGIRVSLAEARTFENPFRVREVKPGDLPAIRRMHAAQEHRTACSLVRTVGHLSCKWERFRDTRVLTDEQGKVVAYYWVQDRSRPGAESLYVADVGVAEPGLCGSVVAAAGHDAEEGSHEEIRFCAPPSHVFSRYLLPFRSRHEMALERDSGGMMVFLDAGEALEAMIPEWEALVAGSALRGCRTEFTAFVSGTPYRMRANRGAIDVSSAYGKGKISLTKDELMHLVTGYRYPEDILETHRHVMAPEARALFLTIFPKRCPFVWPFDRF